MLLLVNLTPTVPFALARHSQLLRFLRRLENLKSRQRHINSRGAGPRRQDLTSAGGDSNNFRPFYSPDEWDDTGVFTVAPRPKYFPCETKRRQRQHVLATPVLSSPSSLSLAAPFTGDSPGMTSPPPNDTSYKPQEFGSWKDWGSGEGLGMWPERRRKVRRQKNIRMECIASLSFPRYGHSTAFVVFPLAFTFRNMFDYATSGADYTSKYEFSKNSNWGEYDIFLILRRKLLIFAY